MNNNAEDKGKKDLNKALKFQEDYEKVSAWLSKMIEQEEEKKKNGTATKKHIVDKTYKLDNDVEVTYTFNYDDVDRINQFIERVNKKIEMLNSEDIDYVLVDKVNEAAEEELAGESEEEKTRRKKQVLDFLDRVLKNNKTEEQTQEVDKFMGKVYKEQNVDRPAVKDTDDTDSSS